MNREDINKKLNAEENSSAILLCPTGALASQDLRANSVHPVGIFISKEEHKAERKRKNIIHCRKYYAEHREERKNWQRKYHEDHKEERLAYNRNYQITHYKEHLEYGRKYQIEHKEEIRQYRFKNRVKIRKVEKIYRKTKPYAAVLKYINQRCYNPNNKNYRSYGARGIKNFLKLEDIKFLWFKDKAYLLKQPSIDKINNDGNYTIKNCRFIELSENSRKSRKSLEEYNKLTKREA